MDRELRKKLCTREALEAARKLVDWLPVSLVPDPLMDEWCRLEDALDELDRINE